MTIAAADSSHPAGHPVIAGILAYLQERRLQLREQVRLGA